MEKTSQQLEILRIKQKGQTIVESPSFLYIQDFIKNIDNKKDLQLEYVFNDNIICDWPAGRNYYFSKKMICSPDGSMLQYRNIGYSQGKILVKSIYRFPEMVLLGKVQEFVTEKTKDFLLF